MAVSRKKPLRTQTRKPRRTVVRKKSAPALDGPFVLSRTAKIALTLFIGYAILYFTIPITLRLFQLKPVPQAHVPQPSVRMQTPEEFCFAQAQLRADALAAPFLSSDIQDPVRVAVAENWMRQFARQNNLDEEIVEGRIRVRTLESGSSGHWMIHYDLILPWTILSFHDEYSSQESEAFSPRILHTSLLTTDLFGCPAGVEQLQAVALSAYPTGVTYSDQQGGMILGVVRNQEGCFKIALPIDFHDTRISITSFPCTL